MKKNFEAWDIKLDEYLDQWEIESKLKFFVRFGILAPSPHNTQPWKVSINNSTLTIKIDQQDKLGIASDPDNRQTMISIGTFLENIILVAKHFGYITTYTINSHTNDTSITVDFSKNQEEAEAENLSKYIPLRTNNKFPYTRTLMSMDLEKELKNLQSNNVSLTIIKDKDIIRQISEIHAKAISEALKTKSFKDELSSLIRNNLTKKFTGMPGYTSGMNTPMSFLGSRIIKNIDVSPMVSKAEKELIINTPCLIYINSDDTETNWIEVGQIYQLISLNAIKFNFATCALAATTEMSYYRQKIRELLKLTKQPQILMRLGEPTVTGQHTPRKPVELILS